MWQRCYHGLTSFAPPLCCVENRNSPALSRLKDKGGANQAQGGEQIKGGGSKSNPTLFRFSIGNALMEENHAAHGILKHPASRHAKIRGEQIKAKGGSKSKGGGAKQLHPFFMFSLGNTLTEENHAAHEILKHPASRHAKIRGEQIKPKGGNK